MSHKRHKSIRILAITPSTRGFGYAVVDDGKHLVDWCVKTAKGKEKNAQSVKHAEKLMAKYLPSQLVMGSHKDSRRSERIKTLTNEIIAIAQQRKIRVRQFSREQVYRTFHLESNATKHALAEVIAGLFPEELRGRLPPKRRAWMSEDARMDIFEAVGLGLHGATRTKAKSLGEERRGA